MNRKKQLFQNSTNNGRTGFALTKANSTRRLGTVYNITKGRKTIRPGMARLGSGAQGVTYLASTDKAGKKQVVIKVTPKDLFFKGKQPARVEYDIQKAAHAADRRHVPAVYSFAEERDFVPASSFNKHSSNFDYHTQYVMMSEYAHGGTLKDWFKKVGSRIRDSDMRDIIRQVIITLKKIRARHPQFVHGDMHMGNLFVDDTGAKPRIMLGDFGLSRLTATGSNPLINSAAHRNSGLTSQTSNKYDAHFFFNSLEYEIRHRGMKLPETLAFLARMLPTGYKGSNTTHTKAWRLKNGAPNGPLPTLTQVLADPFMSGKGPKVKASAVSPGSLGRRLLRRSSPRNSNLRKRLTAVAANRTGRNAAEIARNALANLPGVSVSVNGGARRRPTAKEFAAMSPRARKALKVKNVANSRTVTTTHKVALRGKAIERVTTSRVALPKKYMNMGGGGRATAFHTAVRPTNRFSPLRERPEVKQRGRTPSPKSRASSSGSYKSPVPVPSSGSTPSPRRNSGRPVALAPLGAANRARIKKGLAKAKKNARANIRARAPIATNAKKLLTAYANSLSNQRLLTRRMLKAKLMSTGMSATNANTKARAWEANWIKSRRNVNAATANALRHPSRNLANLGYHPNVIPLARRRAAARLTKGPNGRVRANKKILVLQKKDVLVAMARRHGIMGANAMTKEKIVNALYG